LNLNAHIVNVNCYRQAVRGNDAGKDLRQLHAEYARLEEALQLGAADEAAFMRMSELQALIEAAELAAVMAESTSGGGGGGGGSGGGGRNYSGGHGKSKGGGVVDDKADQEKMPASEEEALRAVFVLEAQLAELEQLDRGEWQRLKRDPDALFAHTMRKSDLEARIEQAQMRLFRCRDGGSGDGGHETKSGGGGDGDGGVDTSPEELEEWAAALGKRDQWQLALDLEYPTASMATRWATVEARLQQVGLSF